MFVLGNFLGVFVGTHPPMPVEFKISLPFCLGFSKENLMDGPMFFFGLKNFAEFLGVVF